MLTGASFYHNYFNHLYTSKCPTELRDFVDKSMNCEDILMNFLSINATRKAPIKITPRKFFKSPTKSISAKSGHFDTRSECVNLFQNYFNELPHPYTTEFRGDPVLYKVQDSQSENIYPDVGTL